MKKLTPNERSDLERRLKKPKDFTERNRLCVILGYDDGLEKNVLAATLRISSYTVEEYLRDYHFKGKTHNDPRGGRETKLSDDEEKHLLDHLKATTYLKVKPIIDYVFKKFGVFYSRTGLRDWLVRNGFTYKKPEKVPGKVDLERQSRFIEEYETLKKTIGADEEIHFIDASHPEYQSQNVCGWIKKGEKKTIQTTGKQPRLHIVGSLCLNGMKVFTQEYKTVDAKAMLDFFTKLEESSTASVIHVILDNGRAHKNKEVEAALKESRIKLRYLPPYSPNLNPIERLWKLLRETVHYNRYYSTAIEFFDQVRNFFIEKLPKMKATLEFRINDRFQVMKLNPVKMGV